VKRIRVTAVIGIAVVTAAGLSTIAACGSAAQAPASASTPGGSAYSYYRTLMGRLSSGSSGSMMGSTPSRTWMMSGSGYRWMTGGADAPSWMRGRALPGYMMGTTENAGKVMGALFADAPGARVSPALAARLGGQVPASATVSRTRNQITFSGTSVRLTVLASPSGGPDETFRIAGMVDPTIVVKAHVHVSMQVVNADPDTAHGLVITASGARSSWMPMATARPIFLGSAVWFLGNPTSAGMHAAILSFTVGPPGTYRYLCPVPGHAQEGMTGTFIVST
jgi:rusticyanin